VTTEQLVLSAAGTLLTIVGAGIATWMSAMNKSVDEIKEQGAETSKALAVIHTTLVGVNGDNGINSEVKALRSRTHHLANDVHKVEGTLALHALRLQTLEDK
jgi:hypothetical protein